MPLIRPRVQRSDKAPFGKASSGKASDGRTSVSVEGEAGDGSILKAILGWIPIEVITAYPFNGKRDGAERHT